MRARKSSREDVAQTGAPSSFGSHIIQPTSTTTTTTTAASHDHHHHYYHQQMNGARTDRSTTTQSTTTRRRGGSQTTSPSWSSGLKPSSSLVKHPSRHKYSKRSHTRSQVSPFASSAQIPYTALSTAVCRQHRFLSACYAHIH